MSKVKFASRVVKREGWLSKIGHKRKPNNRQKTSLTKELRTVKWLFAALLFFDRTPHNSLSNSRELWGILSKKILFLLRSIPYESNYAKRCLLLTFKVNTWGSTRGPPLLKSCLFKISENGGWGPLPRRKASPCPATSAGENGRP